MKISVLIPTYNSARFIGATIESVLRQTRRADEILVLDDGSTDDTVAILKSFPQITLLEQKNGGVASARNVLAKRAQGDLLAFLDHDDIWHPHYLATQERLFAENPSSAVLFTSHENFFGHDIYQWKKDEDVTDSYHTEVLTPLIFFKQYHAISGKFASMSYCCIPKKFIELLGDEPFCKELSGVDDLYIFHRLLLLGSSVYHGRPLVAYRITSGAQSASLLKAVGKAVRAMAILKPHFKSSAGFFLNAAFNGAFAAQRREYGRVLMGAGNVEESRKQLALSFANSLNPLSLGKSLVWLLLTVVPSKVQPKWPSPFKVSHTGPTVSP